jgi:hypothetical protein
VDRGAITILVVSGVASIACWVVAWRSNDHLASKLLWSFIAAIPGLGPLLFAVLRDPPPVQAEADRASGAWDVPDNSHGHTPDHLL